MGVSRLVAAKKKWTVGNNDELFRTNSKNTVS